MKTRLVRLDYREIIAKRLNRLKIKLAGNPDLPSALETKIETRKVRHSVRDLVVTVKQTEPKQSSLHYLSLYDALRKFGQLKKVLRACKIAVCRNDTIAYSDGRVYHPTVYLHRGFKGLEIRLGMIAAQESWRYPSLCFEV